MHDIQSCSNQSKAVIEVEVVFDILVEDYVKLEAFLDIFRLLVIDLGLSPIRKILYLPIRKPEI